MYFNNIVRAIAKQPDNKLLVGGDFTQYLNRNYNYIIRLNNNLTIDESFNVGNGFNNTVNSILLESNAILVGGTFDLYKNIPVKNFARLDFNGNLIGGPIISSSSSSLFSSSSSSSSSSSLSSSSSSSSSSSFSEPSSSSSSSSSFSESSSSSSSSISSDELPYPPQNLRTSDITSTYFVIKWDPVPNATRYRIDVATDENFTNILTQFNNKSVTGLETVINNLEINTLYYTRIRAQNNVNTTSSSDVFLQNTYLNRGEPIRNFTPVLLGGGGVPSNWWDGPSDIDFDEITKNIYIVGDFRYINSNIKCEHIARLLPNGDLDPTFSRVGADGKIHCVHYSTGLNKIYIGGGFAKAGAVDRNLIARLNYDGTVDNTFIPPTGLRQGYIATMHVFEDGSVVAGGLFRNYYDPNSDNFYTNIIKLNPDGSEDTTFYIRTINNIVFDIKPTQSSFGDQLLFAAGQYNQYCGIWRTFNDGLLDSTFTSPINLVQNCFDGPTYVIGSTSTLIYVGGGFSSYLGRPFYPNAIQLNINGGLGNGRFNFKSSNQTLQPVPGINYPVQDLLVQEDNSVIVVGRMTTASNSFYLDWYDRTFGGVVALKENGDLDKTFNHLYGKQADNIVNTISSINSGNNIIIGGGFYKYDDVQHDRLCIINNIFTSSSSSSNNYITPSAPQNLNVYSVHGPWQQYATSPAENIGAQVNVKWAPVSNATSYRVETSLSSTFSSLFTTSKVLTTHFRLNSNSLTMGTTVYIRVKSINIAGESSYSNIVSATIPPFRHYRNPTVTQASPSQITVFIRDLKLWVKYVRIDISTDNFYLSQNDILSNQLFGVNGGQGQVTSASFNIAADFIPNNTTIYIRYRVQSSVNGLASENSTHGTYYFSV